MKKGMQNKLRIELKEDTVLRLLRSGHAWADEMTCLDYASKECLRLLCMKSCGFHHELSNMQPSRAGCRNVISDTIYYRRRKTSK